MFDQSVNPSSLKFAIQEPERSNFSREYANPDNLIAEAIDTFANELALNILNTNKVKNNIVYQLNCAKSALLQRRLILNLTTINKAKQSNRNSIIKSIHALLEDDSRYSVLRLDIRSFYESCSRHIIMNRLLEDPAYGSDTCKLVNLFFDLFEQHNIRGLPRGLGLSAILSEFYMRKFDHILKNNDSTLYYARFVDDIILITLDTPEDAYQLAQTALPDNLEFNLSNEKFKHFSVPSLHDKKLPNNAEKKEISFDYLGYKFQIDAEKKLRRVTVDIAEKKINRIKERLIKALLLFLKHRDFRMLESRVRFLSSNFIVGSRKRSTKKRTGIYYNYQMLTTDNGLDNLDQFLSRLCFDNTFQQSILGSPLNLTESPLVH